MTKDEKRDFFDALAGARDKWYSRSRYYHREHEDYLRFLIPEGSSILEVGCGTGNLLAAVARGGRAVGVDFSPRMIEIAREKHPDIEFHVMDAEELDLDEKFDSVILDDTVGHLEDIQKALECLKRVVRRDTRIIIRLYSQLWGPLLKLLERLGLKMPSYEQNWLTRGDMENLLGLAGFEAIRFERRTMAPAYLPVMSHVANHFLAKLPILKHLCLVNVIVARPAAERLDGLSSSVVIACRNERGNIRDAVRRTPVLGSSTEIIFVDGSSTDGTPDEIKAVIAEKPDRDISLIHQGDGTGKGDAVRKGFAAAKHDVLMILDADLTVPPEDLPKFYEALASGKGEFINGVRLVYPMEKQAMRFLNLLGNKVFSLIFTWLLGERYRDTLCGTKVLTRANYERIAANREYFGDFDPFGDFDLIFGANKLLLKTMEVPVRYRERTYGTTNISRFRHGWLLLRMCGVALAKLKLK